MMRRFFIALLVAFALAPPAHAQSGLATPNWFWAGPPSGSSQAFATWRAPVSADFPAGVVPTAALANQSTTVNGTVCTLGSTCTVTATIGGVTIGTTTITSGTTLRPLYDNAGVLGEYTAAQMTAFINLATASLSGALPAWPNNTTTYFRGDGTYATHNFASLGGSAACGQLPPLTGDITSSSCATTLATVNSNIGGFGSGTFIPNFTVNGKGLVTAAGQTAISYAASALTGGTLAAGVTASSLTSVGALAGGSATTGFTINAANVTWSGLIPAANLPKATSVAFGVVEPDNSTIMITAGVISAPGSGGGTVSSCAQYSVPAWLGAGTTTTLNCIAPAANALLGTSGSNVPSLVTALPTGMGINATNMTWSGTIPGANQQAANLAASGNGGVTGILTAANLPAGVPANVLRSVTSNDTVLTSDCGKTLQLGTGSTGFFTETLPVVSGFTANCIVTVVNGDTGRGKGLSGFPAGLNSSAILWPTQAVTVQIVNGVWALQTNPGPWQLSGAISFYVRPDGNDSNDGLANSSGGAFLTANKALYTIADQVNINSQFGGSATVVHTCASPPCTITAAAQLVQFVTGVTFVGGIPTYQGDAAGTTLAPSTSANQADIQVTYAPSVLNVGANLTLAGGTNVSYGLYVSGGAQVRLSGGIIWGNVTGASSTHMVAASGGRIFVLASDTIANTSSVVAHEYAYHGGIIEHANGLTQTCTGNPPFTIWALAATGGNLNEASQTFTGCSGVTGQRYNAQSLAVIDTIGGGATYYPGNSGGVINGTTPGGGYF